MRAVSTASLCLALALPLAAQDMPPTPVIVDEIRAQETEAAISLVGTVRPRRSSLVASQTEGLVVDRLCDPGAALRRGTPLMRLRNDALRASLIEALADVSLRRFEYQQNSQLLRQEAVAEEVLRSAEYELERARAKLQELESRVEDLVIRAPFDGQLTEVRAEVGEWVTRGQAVARAVSADTVWVWAEVPESFVGDLRLGQEVEVVVGALGVEPRRAPVVAILAAGSDQARTFPVGVELANPDGALRGGMAARVDFRAARTGTALLVHKDALVNDPRGTSIFVVADGSARQRPVRPGLAHQGYVAVEGEVRAGDLAVVRGNERLRDGQAVRVLRKQN